MVATGDPLYVHIYTPLNNLFEVFLDDVKITNGV